MEENETKTHFYASFIRGRFFSLLIKNLEKRTYKLMYVMSYLYCKILMMLVNQHIFYSGVIMVQMHFFSSANMKNV